MSDELRVSTDGFSAAVAEEKRHAYQDVILKYGVTYREAIDAAREEGP